MPQKDFNDEDLIKSLLQVLRTRYRANINIIADDPELMLGETRTQVGGRWKKQIGIDIYAQSEFKSALKRANGGKYSYIEVHGEEDLDDGLNLEPTAAESSEIGGDQLKQRRLYALVDMIDGSDLLERGLSNWCSAVCIYEPDALPGRRILATFVVTADGEIFYSGRDRNDVTVQIPRQIDHRYHEIPLPNLRHLDQNNFKLALKDASICFYGQKVSSLLSILPRENPAEGSPVTLLDYIQKIDKSEKQKIAGKERPNSDDIPIGFRIYTLDGIPMLARLIDYRIKKIHKIDVVFNVTGQSPHDVVGGVYLAMKAGAIVINMDTGIDLTLEDMENALMRPAKSKLRYVVASNRALADEIYPLLKPLLRPLSA